MRDSQWLRPLALDLPPAPCPVVAEHVFWTSAEGPFRRIFWATLRNDGPTAALVVEIALPPPFRPSAAVMTGRLFTLNGMERMRVELGTTAGASPGVDDVLAALRLRCA